MLKHNGIFKPVKKDFLDFDLFEIPDVASCVFLSVWYFAKTQKSKDGTLRGTQIILESNGIDLMELFST